TPDARKTHHSLNSPACSCVSRSRSQRRGNYWLPVVPVLPVVVLDLPVTPPPPLTSFSGRRSRTWICPFFIRRQTDRIALILRSLFCASTTNYFVAALSLGWPTDPIITNILAGCHPLKSPACSRVSITLPASS